MHLITIVVVIILVFLVLVMVLIVFIAAVFTLAGVLLILEVFIKFIIVFKLGDLCLELL